MIPRSAASVHIQPTESFSGAGGAFAASVRLPGSKSLTNRALLVAGCAFGESRLTNVLDCDDSRYLRSALESLGVRVRVEPETRDASGKPAPPVWLVQGVGGHFPVKEARFDLGNAGTSTRFLTAVLTTARGDFVVDGDSRMRTRPIADLVKALRDLGADIDAPTGCPPVRIGSRRLSGGKVEVSGGVSSQFISAILLAGPMAERNIDIRIRGDLVSKPYVELTLETMRAFSARAWLDEGRADGVPTYCVVASGERKPYIGREWYVEGDASAASYFFAAAAISGETLRVEGVGKESPQGDIRCADVFAEMGCRVNKEVDAITVTGAGPYLNGVNVDCADMPDVVPTLAVAAAFARGRTRLRGVPHLRHKESDRIASVASELRKIGASVRELDDGLQIEGCLGRDDVELHGAEIDTWHDHRIAMAMSVAALRVPGVVITRPQVVTKSYPEFFAVLRTLGVPVFFCDTDGNAIEQPEGAGA